MLPSLDERSPAPGGPKCSDVPVQESARPLTDDDERFLADFDRKFADFLDHAATR